MVFRVILISVAYLVLGAHFLRDWNLALVVLCALAPFLLFIKKRWVLFVLQAGVYLGTVVWVMTTYEIFQQRVAMGEPWLRMIIILGSVAALTLVSGLLLNARAVRERYS